MEEDNPLDNILDEVIAWSAPLPLQPDEFTIADYTTRLKQWSGEIISKGAARGRLETLVAQGKLIKRSVVHHGTHCNAYRVADPASKLT